MKPGLHVVAVIDSLTPAAWVADLIQRLSSNRNITFNIVRADSPEPGSPAQTNAIIDKANDAGATPGWWMHRFDRPLFKHDPWAVTELPESAPVMLLDSDSTLFSGCDVVLNLGLQDTLPAIIKRAQLPCWSAQTDTLEQRVEHYLLHNAPLMWIHLWETRVNPQTSEMLSTRVASHSLPCHTYSISDLKRLCFASLPALFESRLNWMANDAGLLENIETQDTALGVFETERNAARQDAQAWQNPANSHKSTYSPATVISVARVFKRQIIERIRARFFEECWQLALHEGSAESILEQENIKRVPIDAFKDLATSDDATWADPHTVCHCGEQYVFFEKMQTHNKHAHIAVAKLDASGVLGTPSIALEEKNHLSYPFVFKHQDEHYMIPETGTLNSIRLYKAKEFPHNWQPVAELVSDINAADTTLLYHHNRWWLFTNCQSHRCVDERDELHLYHADELTGPWQPHRLNPVLTGVDRSRMGGSIITRSGTLYRPSQYGAYRYGRGINISRIDELSPTTYRETALHRMTPEEGSRWQGCHTLGFSNEFTIIDRVRYRRKRK